MLEHEEPRHYNRRLRVSVILRLIASKVTLPNSEKTQQFIVITMTTSGIYQALAGVLEIETHARPVRRVASAAMIIPSRHLGKRFVRNKYSSTQSTRRMRGRKKMMNTTAAIAGKLKTFSSALSGCRTKLIAIPTMSRLEQVRKKRSSSSNNLRYSQTAYPNWHLVFV